MIQYWIIVTVKQYQRTEIMIETFYLSDNMTLIEPFFFIKLLLVVGP